jgi:hypothetical protein
MVKYFGGVKAPKDKNIVEIRPPECYNLTKDTEEKGR